MEYCSKTEGNIIYLTGLSDIDHVGTSMKIMTFRDKETTYIRAFCRFEREFIKSVVLTGHTMSDIRSSVKRHIKDSMNNHVIAVEGV